MSSPKLTPALAYHKYPTPGKLSIQPSKNLSNQKELALAYSPGVAEACLAIQEDPITALDYTIKGNLVAVISNGTAVLGLGNIGALASKPVMEGKSVLFKKFAGVNSIDIEIDETDPKKLIEIIASLEPSFGAINLEDIKSPECFEIEQTLKERMNIPVFHDDQHGTAVVVGAAVHNALALTGKKIEDVRLVSTGGGAAGIACLTLLHSMGIRKENIFLFDLSGLVTQDRPNTNREKLPFAQPSGTELTVEEALVGADLFIGLSAANLLTPDMIKPMAPEPLLMALANPDPEINPELALQVRPDAIIATGRSDYPNQVNNVLCFPYIFRGALDVGARKITTKMKLAASRAIASLTKTSGSEMDVQSEKLIIPRPFDERLLSTVAPAVAQAAMDEGIAVKPIHDFDAYTRALQGERNNSFSFTWPLIEHAQKAPKRIAFADGEEFTTLLATQDIVSEYKFAYPILIGRPDVIESRIERLGLNLTINKDFEVVNPQADHRYRQYWQYYHEKLGRYGVSADVAKLRVRTIPSVIAALMVDQNEADGMIAGISGNFSKNLRLVRPILGLKPGKERCYALTILLTERFGPLFIGDTHINQDITAEQLAEFATMASLEMMKYNIVPKAAFLSHSNFGQSDLPDAIKMRKAHELFQAGELNVMSEGEIRADLALNPQLRKSFLVDNILDASEANLLLMPDLNSASISMNLVHQLTGATKLGPILLGLNKPGQILNYTSSHRDIVHACALTVAQAQHNKS